MPNVTRVLRQFGFAKGSDMKTSMLVAIVWASLVAAIVVRGSMLAQSQCLHGQNEDAAQRARRAAAVRMVRAINTAEVDGPRRSGAHFHPLAELRVDLAGATGF